MGVVETGFDIETVVSGFQTYEPLGSVVRTTSTVPMCACVCQNSDFSVDDLRDRAGQELNQ